MEKMDLDDYGQEFRNLINEGNTFKPLDKLIDQGNFLYQKGLAALNEQDYQSAAKLFIKALKLGNKNASYFLVIIFAEGLFYKKSKKLVLKYLEDISSGNGFYYIALLYQKGTVLEQDYEKAFSFYKKAQEEGYSSDYNLGYLYYNGLGVEKNYNLAFTHFEKSYLDGSIHGKLALGYLYYFGHGVKQNFIRALSLFNDCGKAGMGEAYYMCGLLFEEKRIGGQEGNPKAIEFYELSKNLGYKLAEEKIQKLKPKSFFEKIFGGKIK